MSSSKTGAPALTAAQYLAACETRGLRLDVGPMRALTAALGHPELSYATLLVAGTNGKGSVVACVEAVLRASGHRTGRFTSPALRRVEEQVAVGGRAIDAAELDAAMAEVQAAAAAGAVEPTAFEALTAAAFAHFRRAHVDVAVVEVGLGGRDDATNVAAPLASAVVSVALDHERFLGSDLAGIARVKAGVMRAGRATVLGPLPPEARHAVLREAAARGALIVDGPQGVVLDDQPEGLSVSTPSGVYRGLRPLPGAHQRDNLVVALRLLEAAHDSGLRVDFDALPAAVAGVRWPGRLQAVSGRPPLLLDGAHNPAGARALAAHVQDRGRMVLLFGAMADKRVEDMAAALFPAAEAVVLTRAGAAPRAAAPEALAARAGVFARRLHLEPRPERALALARRLALAGGPGHATVLVAGSLALVGAVLDLLEGTPARGRAGGAT